MDDKGLLDPTTRKGRSVKYTIYEDKLLSLSWKKIGVDVLVGTEQPMNTYWDRMKEFFDARNKSDNDRAAASLCHRWSTMMLDC